MAKSRNTIEELLEQRAKFEDWLGKLDETQKLASESVRDRIRTDYEKRLNAVVDELRGHSDAVAEQLAELRVTQSDLTSQQESSEEALAEAEVRHAVGEYDDEEWEKIHGESSEALEGVKAQLEQINTEIDRLAEVQALIAGPTRKPKAKAASGTSSDLYRSDAWVPDAKQAAGTADVTPTPPAPLEETGAPRQRASAPKFVPRGKSKGAKTPKTLRFPTGKVAGTAAGAKSDLDELDFLKSVSEDEEQGPSPHRASGGYDTPLEQEAIKDVPPAAATKGEKTLKCPECGGQNLPTEWYCESCGAELASL